MIRFVPTSWKEWGHFLPTLMKNPYCSMSPDIMRGNEQHWVVHWGVLYQTSFNVLPPIFSSHTCPQGPWPLDSPQPLLWWPTRHGFCLATAMMISLPWDNCHAGTSPHAGTASLPPPTPHPAYCYWSMRCHRPAQLAQCCTSGVRNPDVQGN